MRVACTKRCHRLTSSNSNSQFSSSTLKYYVKRIKIHSRTKWIDSPNTTPCSWMTLAQSLMQSTDEWQYISSSFAVAAVYTRFYVNTKCVYAISQYYWMNHINRQLEHGIRFSQTWKRNPSISNQINLDWWSDKLFEKIYVLIWMKSIRTTGASSTMIKFDLIFLNVKMVLSSSNRPRWTVFKHVDYLISFICAWEVIENDKDAEWLKSGHCSLVSGIRDKRNFFIAPRIEIKTVREWQPIITIAQSLCNGHHTTNIHTVDYILPVGLIVVPHHIFTLRPIQSQTIKIRFDSDKIEIKMQIVQVKL